MLVRSARGPSRNVIHDRISVTLADTDRQVVLEAIEIKYRIIFSGVFNAVESRNNIEAYEKLLPLMQKVTRVQEPIDDTMMLIGSDQYLAALEQYAAAKRAGRTEGLDVLMDVLGRRFASR